MFDIPHVLFLLIVSPSFIGCAAQRNVTLDDTDPAIVYSPKEKWGLSAGTNLDAGGAHMLTEDITAVATLVFNGEDSSIRKTPFVFRPRR